MSTRSRNEKQYVVCPVCGASAAADSFSEKDNMCGRCQWILVDCGGQDTGRFMYYIVDRRADTQTSGRQMKLRPRGFWSSDVISVSERKDIFGSKDWTVEMNHSCGGEDGTLSSLECHANFALAMNFALDIARVWEAERKAVAGLAADMKEEVK